MTGSGHRSPTCLTQPPPPSPPHRPSLGCLLRCLHSILLNMGEGKGGCHCLLSWRQRGQKTQAIHPQGRGWGRNGVLACGLGSSCCCLRKLTRPEMVDRSEKKVMDKDGEWVCQSSASWPSVLGRTLPSRRGGGAGGRTAGKLRVPAPAPCARPGEGLPGTLPAQVGGDCGPRDWWVGGGPLSREG